LGRAHRAHDTLYEEARLARLGTEKFMLDGRHTGTGGGNHVTLGGPTAADSPMLRRPDMLQSLITYWQNHPALSYLFSGMFIGPTSQSPRVDEARARHALRAGDRVPAARRSSSSRRAERAAVARRSHPAQFPRGPHRQHAPRGIFHRQALRAGTRHGRLGILEFRAFEMPPHARMSLLQTLLLRALVARFWARPYRERWCAGARGSTTSSCCRTSWRRTCAT
jgi:uncharacterized protein (DUF2126 family)